MYTSFAVRNFRCFLELNMSNLKQVNLIAGTNNIGKTALLEALFVHCGAYNPALALRINSFRGIEEFRVEFAPWAETPWDSLFTGFDISQEIELRGNLKEPNGVSRSRILKLRVIRQPEELTKIGQFVKFVSKETTIAPLSSKETAIASLSSGVAQVLELECIELGQRTRYYMILDPQGPRTEPIPPPPPFPAIFLAARYRVPLTDDARRFGKLEIERRHDVVLEALKVIEPQLKDLAVVVTNSGPMLHGDIGIGKMIPLPLLGDGMARLASLVLAIGNAPNGVVLVDEVENGLHHTILPKVWEVIRKVAKEFNTQIFATTHSLECIKAAHKAFSQDENYDFSLHRLERVGKTLHVTTYDRETLEAAIEMNLEVR